eukprot:4731897-Pyramimonas_sp.AAC.1
MHFGLAHAWDIQLPRMKHVNAARACTLTSLISRSSYSSLPSLSARSADQIKRASGLEGCRP